MTENLDAPVHILDSIDRFVRHRIARSTTLAAQIIKRADLYDNRFRGTLPASMEMRYDRALAILNKATEGKEVWHV